MFPSFHFCLLSNTTTPERKKEGKKMGSGSEGYSKKHSQQQAQTKYKLKMLVLVTLTHLLTVYVFTNPSFNLKLSGYTNHIPFRIWDSTDLLHELNSTRDQLAASHLLIAELHQKLNSTNLLVQALLIVLNSHHEALTEKKVSQPLMKFSDRFGNAVFDELMLAVGPHKLPLGYSPRMGSGEVYTSMGAGCLKYQEELSQYMKYEIGGECPVDDVFAQRLIMRLVSVSLSLAGDASLNLQQTTRSQPHYQSLSGQPHQTPALSGILIPEKATSVSLNEKMCEATWPARIALTCKAGRRQGGCLTMEDSIMELIKFSKQNVMELSVLDLT